MDLSFSQIVPWLISAGSLAIAYLSYKRNTVNDIHEEDQRLNAITESLLKANMKLDQVCSTTAETRTDIKAMQNHISDLDKEIAVIKRDLSTAFHKIDELKGGSKHEN